MKPLIIAFYLPQFHPFKENDEWWGKGFTEWTNVGKAKSLFRGHNQPRVPTELGYYDLRLPIIREQQAQMAREAGVSAFCYWHYWFGNGTRLIPEVFQEVLETGKPDFPFCLGWANHSWMAKNWNSDGTTKERMLMEQTYPGENDIKMHGDFLIKAFKDPRYVKIDGMPLFYIFDAISVPDDYICGFRKQVKEAGFPDLLLVANTSDLNYKKEYFLERGFDLVSFQRLRGAKQKDIKFKGQQRIEKYINIIKGFMVRKPPFMREYSKAFPNFIVEEDKDDNVIPSIIPQWDHSPRSGWNGLILNNSTPELFYNHVLAAFDAIKFKPNNRKIIFLRSWNEWGEGNYMEPDITFGRGYINALRKAINEYEF